MRLSLHALAAGAFLLMGAHGRKRLVNGQNQKVKAPRVMDCEPVCVFDEEVDSWCFEFTTPHFQAGWEWAQTFSETDDDPALKYFQIEWIPYLQAGFIWKSLMNIERLYDHEFDFELADFKVNIFFSQIVSGNFQYCPGVGHENEAIELTLTLRQGIIECYKTIINDVCSFDGVWKGKLSKYFEECEKSDADEDDEVVAEFNTWEFLAEQTDMMWAGSVDPESVVFCKDLPLIAKTSNDPLTRYAKMAYTAVGSYVWTNYKEAGGITMPNVLGALL